MLKVKVKRPDLYIPSSGEMERVKWRISSGSGKSVFMVLPRESSERSVGWEVCQLGLMWHVFLIGF